MFSSLILVKYIIPVTNIKTKRGNSVSWHFKQQVFSADLVVAKALCSNKAKSSSAPSWDYHDQGY